MVCFCAGKRPHSREACESPPLCGGPGPSDQDRWVGLILCSRPGQVGGVDTVLQTRTGGWG